MCPARFKVFGAHPMHPGRKAYFAGKEPLLSAIRTISAALATALALSVAACGGGGGSDADQIRDVAQGFVRDAKSKDWNGVCGALSTKAKAQLSIAAVFFGGGDCATTMKTVFSLDSGNSLSKIAPDAIRVRRLKITGDHAVGEMVPSTDGDATTRFVREDGRWKLDAEPGNGKSTMTVSSGKATDGSSARPAPRLAVAERGFSRTGESTSYGLVVKNPSKTDAVSVEVQVNLVGANDEVLATETASLAGVPAAAAVDVGGDSDTHGERVRRLEVTVTGAQGAPAGTVKLPEVSYVRVSRDDFGLSVRAQVRNTLDQQLSSIADVFAVLRDAGGHVVGGLKGFPKSALQPGGRAAVELGGFHDVRGAVSADVTMDTETADG
jgi:hypothetical protein